MSLKSFFIDKFFLIAAGIGLALMLLTLHYNINPVEGSVVPRHIQGTGIHIFLYISCMPAWIIGDIVTSLLGFLLPVSFTFMACTMQILIYGALGKFLRRFINYFRM